MVRTTVMVDDELIETARRYAQVNETSALIRLALTRYVQSEAARRLARMGGTEPDAEAPPRRRFDMS